MPTVDDWLLKIQSSVREHDSPSAKDMVLIEESLREHPDSFSLWCLRGDLIQLFEDDSTEKYDWSDVIASYQRASEKESTNPRPYESLGYFFDVVYEDFETSELHFRRAIELGAGSDSWIGLARVLAENGKQDDAIALLVSSKCPDTDTEPIKRILNEIRSGEWS